MIPIITRDDLEKTLDELGFDEDYIAKTKKVRNVIQYSLRGYIDGIEYDELTDEELNVVFRYALVYAKKPEAFQKTVNICKSCYSILSLDERVCPICKKVLDNRELVISVDKLIAPVISELNKRGYKTAFCCAGSLNVGHLLGSEAYIAFDKRVDLDLNIFKTLPKTWKLEFTDKSDRPGNSVIVRSDRCTKKCKPNYLDDILNWVISLPIRLSLDTKED